MDDKKWYNKQIDGLILILQDAGNEGFISKEYVIEKLKMIKSGGINFHPTIAEWIGLK